MKTWKALLLAALTLTILIIGLGIWGYLRLDSEMKTRLASKEFLAPTTFWSAPGRIFKGEIWSSEDLASTFKAAGYKESSRSGDLDLREFRWEDCTYLPQSYDQEVHCFHFRRAETLHPSLKNLRSQVVVLNHDNLVVDIWSQNRGETSWNPTNDAAREPTRIAQFVEGEPLLQEWSPLGEIPVSCLNAVLAIEDPRFLEHSGVNWKALFRAVLVNLTRGRFAQGGSTITQQMVKNFFLNSEKTLQRKLKEFAMALILESNLSKDQIFEIYLNIIYLGQSGPFQVRGYQAASQYYFQKKLADLNTSECALLAAVLNSPGKFDPFSRADKAKERRDRVLSKMVEHDFINAEEQVRASHDPLPTYSRPAISDSAPYFIQVAERELAARGINREGANVFTSMIPQRQELAQKSLNAHLAQLEETNSKIKGLKETENLSLEGAVITIDLQSGNITNAVAGRGFRKSPFNRIWDGQRQIGSLAKPFVYETAFEMDSQLNPLSVISDEKITIPLAKKSWSPENYDKKYHGEVSLAYALKNSLNASTASLGTRWDLSETISRMHAAGIQSEIPKVPSLLLGAMDLRPIEVAEAYLTLARLGDHIRPRMIEAVVLADGAEIPFLIDRQGQALQAEAAGMVVGMMKETTRTGTAKAIRSSGFNWNVAGKTGTTSDYKDAWFAGFTPFDLTLVWIGYDQPQSHGLTGGGGALPVWLNTMKEFSRHRGSDDFPFPETLRMEEVTTPPDSDTTQMWLRN